MAEETLDPQDWEELRSLGHRMLDDMLDYLRDVRDRPVWQSPTADARAVIAGPLPRDPSPAAAVYDDFREAILPFPTGNIHPRFWGWVMGTGTPFAAGEIGERELIAGMRRLEEEAAAAPRPRVGSAVTEAAAIAYVRQLRGQLGERPPAEQGVIAPDHLQGDRRPR